MTLASSRVMAIDPKKPPVCDPDDVEPAREPASPPPAQRDPKRSSPSKDPNVPDAPRPGDPPKSR
jgi:hypothetical protein